MRKEPTALLRDNVFHARLVHEVVVRFFTLPQLETFLYVKVRYRHANNFLPIASWILLGEFIRNCGNADFQSTPWISFQHVQSRCCKYS